MNHPFKKRNESQLSSINTLQKPLCKLLVVVIYASLVILIIFANVRMRVYFIPSSSMEGTLQKGDVVWTKKFDRQQLQRDDILVFRKVEKNNSIYLVKRCIALPGDTLNIENGIVSCNGEKEQCKPLYTYNKQLKLYSDSLLLSVDQIINLTSCTIQRTEKNNRFNIIIQQSRIDDIKDAISLYGTIENIPRPRKRGRLFPWSDQIASSYDNFGEIVIPKKGMTISLTGDNIYWYKSVIESEEGEVTITGDRVLIKKNLSRAYTFKRDYLFVMGDNRHDSRDSRVFGFIPVEDVLANATRVLFTIKTDAQSKKKRMTLERSLMRLE